MQIKQAAQLRSRQSLRIIRRSGQVIQGWIMPEDDDENPIELEGRIRIFVTDTGGGEKPGDKAKQWWTITVSTLLNTCEVFEA